MDLNACFHELLLSLAVGDYGKAHIQATELLRSHDKGGVQPDLFKGMYRRHYRALLLAVERGAGSKLN